ncbi:Oxygen-dependent choline dehydrogenase like protein [Argiope bruennichi]|uniref:Oxygen-dependent choline dehydrogenase like protein n=1 Tax=Argiope bruennichi TaxID=94029 RepID=A0A8T0EUY9_ARGBR|nr:Oxygen-dependent choline dehydrogenase like protein [Argiope bruennichi]
MEMWSRYYESAFAAGYQIVDSSVGARQTGFDDFQSTARDSQRCSTAKAYLVPAENRTNLDMAGNAFVKKILFQGNKAIGVEFDRGMMTHQVKARREVIISAGTTNSAQLLMLSGIGPKEHLAKFNIPLVADLPVGDNLQDHIAGFLSYTLSPKIPTVPQKLTNNKNIYEYVFSRTGPLASAEFQSYLAFLNKKSKNPPVDYPDYELYFAEIPKEVAQNEVGLKPEVYKQLFGPYENEAFMFCVSQILHPKSRGTVRLQSNNPYDPPLIDPNYLDHPEDFDDVIAGLKTCKQVGESAPMQKVGLQPFNTTYPGCEKLMGDEYQFFKCMVKNAVITLSHQVGTCKMGDPKDPTTVVDPQLRVKNVKGLRVIDASIMPIVTSGNTNIPTIMIAEKASDMIKQTIGCPNYLQPNYENFINKPLPPMNGTVP